MATQTLSDLLTIASKHGSTRFSVQEAQLSATIAAGTVSNEAIVFPDAAAITVPNGARLTVPNTSGILRLHTTGSGFARQFVSLSGGVPGQVLLVVNAGSKSVIFSSVVGEEDDPVEPGTGFYSVGNRTDIVGTDVVNTTTDEATLYEGQAVLLRYDAQLGWSAVNLLPVDGTVTP